MNKPIKIGYAFISLFLVVTCFANSGCSSSHNKGVLLWAKQICGTKDVVGKETLVLSDGSFIVTGYFRDTVTFGKGEQNEVTITSKDKDNLKYQYFLARYTNNGDLLWAKSIYETTFPAIKFPKIHEASDNTILVIDSCDILYCDKTVASENKSIYFMAKYDMEGVFICANKFEGGISKYIALENGSFIVTGDLIKPKTNLKHDAFIAKYNSDFKIIWYKTVVGDSDARINVDRITTLSDGSVVLTGFFEKTATFGLGELNETTIESTYINMFIAKYDHEGLLSWVKKVGGQKLYRCLAISNLSDDSFVLTGYIDENESSDISQSKKTEIEKLIYAEKAPPIFVARYNSEGSLIWEKNEGWKSSLYSSITVFPDDSILIAGPFSGLSKNKNGNGRIFSVNFDGEFENYYYVKNGIYAMYDKSGDCLWYESVDTAEFAHSRSVSQFTDGSFVVSGCFKGVAEFVTGNNKVTLASPDYISAFIARYKK